MRIVGLTMVAAQLAFRAWAVYPSWFFADDYRLMYDAAGTRLSWSQLLAPFDSHFMPLGRLIVWIVVESGPLSWNLAATITLFLQLAASLACLWMVLTLFGHRWASLAPLAIYLSTAITIPAFMWWAAALNQVPLQAAFFVAVGCWVQYGRTRRARWFVGALLAVCFGLLAYEKALLILPVLGALTVAYFTEGTWRRRLVTLWTEFRPPLLTATAIVAGYLVFYRAGVPQPFETVGPGAPMSIADTMLGTALAAGSVGGPWEWWRTSPPLVLAGPPAWSVHLAWVVIAGAVAYSWFRRHRTGRGWLILLGYSLVTFGLLATTRGQLYGALAGLEYRYLTDVAPVLVLVIGLVFLPLPGAPGSSAPREDPLLRWQAGPRTVAAVVAAICLGGTVSTAGYVYYWHHDHAGASYVRALRDSLDQQGAVPDLVEQVVPATVVPEYAAPGNLSSRFLQLFGTDAAFPDSSDNLQIIDGYGRLHPVTLDVQAKALRGPAPDCGWIVTPPGVTIPLDQAVGDGEHWMRLGYLASDETPLTVSAGPTSVDTTARAGLHQLFVRAEGPFGRVTLHGLESGAALCVDSIDVGEAVPLESP